MTSFLHYSAQGNFRLGCRRTVTPPFFLPLLYIELKVDSRRLLMTSFLHYSAQDNFRLDCRHNVTPRFFSPLLYIELTISLLIHLAADYTIIMPRTLKVTGNHVINDRGVSFLRVLMSSSRALCCLASVK